MFKVLSKSFENRIRKVANISMVASSLMLIPLCKDRSIKNLNEQEHKEYVKSCEKKQLDYSYYDYASTTLWFDSSQEEHGAKNNVLYGSSKEDSAYKLREFNSWIVLKDLIQKISDSGYDFDDSDIKCVEKIFCKSDLDNNKVLQGVEKDAFFNQLEKTNLKRKNTEVYNALSIIEERNNSSLDNNVAQNFKLAVDELKEPILIDQALAHLNKDNVYNIVKDYYELSEQSSSFFYKIMTFGVIYASDSKLSKKIYDDVIEAYEGLLQQAEKVGVYTKDFQEFIERYKNLNRKQDLAKEVDNLFERIYLKKEAETLKDSSLSKRSLELQEPNGILYETFAQGRAQNCWFLASLISALNHPIAKVKLNENVIIEPTLSNDSVEVFICNKRYPFDRSELYGAIEYSTGDLDVRALEIAVNKSMQQQCLSINKGYSDISKGFEQLFGKDKIDVMHYNVNSDFLEEMKKTQGMIVLGTDKKNFEKCFLNEKNEVVKPVSSHVYSVVDVSSEYVYLINPWDSSEKLKCNLNDVNKIFNKAVIVNLK